MKDWYWLRLISLSSCRVVILSPEPPDDGVSLRRLGVEDRLSASAPMSFIVCE